MGLNFKKQVHHRLLYKFSKVNTATEAFKNIYAVYAGA